jgi:flagellar protein FliO/FliZ
MTPNLGSLLWFVAIVAMIPLALWMLKRTPLGGSMGARAGAPRTVASLALSAQQKIVTVEVGQGLERQWLVLGVSAQGIRTLHTMPVQDAAPTDPLDNVDTAPPVAFAQMLSRLRGGPAKGASHD